MTGPFTGATRSPGTLTSLIAQGDHDLDCPAWSGMPDSGDTAGCDCWKAEALAETRRIATHELELATMADAFDEFLTGLGDQLNILAGRDDVRDVAQRMIFRFRTEHRDNYAAAIGRQVDAAAENVDVH